MQSHNLPGRLDVETNVPKLHS